MLLGTVTDPTGAVIPGAAVHVASERATEDSELHNETDRAGNFQFSIGEGKYVLRVEAAGFASYASGQLAVRPGEKLYLPVRLAIASLHEELSVGDDEGARADTSGEQVFQADSLRTLSNDPTILLQQLTALAGGSGPLNIYIDGFSGGRLPSKASIRSIRINRNPYSAYFSDLGMGRVEITTRPGTDKLHGELDLSGTDQPLDARNPYLALELPFYDFQQSGTLSGPINRKTSFLLSDAIESLANNAVVNAADPLNTSSAFLSQGLPAPQRTDTFAVRVDREFSPTNFAHIREEWSQTHILNSGIFPLVLPSAAFTSNILTNTLQIADTQTIGAHAVNDARFQYLRTRTRQDPNSTLPSVIVQSSFQDGGSPAQALRDNGDAFELQDLLELEHGAHAIRTGFRFRAVRDANQSTAGFNGQYIFPDVASFLAGQPSQFSITTGRSGAVLRNDDIGLYAEDDWKVSPNLTFNYGFRLESQSALPDHIDPAPRLGFTYAIRPGKRKTPIVTLRGGYGIFYDRFPVTQLLQAIRQNGINEIAYVAQGTAFNPTGLPPGVVLSAAQPTIYRVSPSLRTSYAQSAMFAVTRTLGRFGTLRGTLIYEHNTHNYLTRNTNAPLPGTYNLADPNSGIRPLGTAQNIYQFSSDGNGNHELFFLNYQLQLSSKLSGYGRVNFTRLRNETEGIEHFPSNQYNLQADYARSSLVAAQSFSGGFQYAAPFGFGVQAFAIAQTGTPFDITTGTDLNGDTIYNDRPALASDPARASVVSTAFGNFDTLPAANQKILPRNAATSPGFVYPVVTIGRDLHLGPRPAAASHGAGPAPLPDRPWNLNFSLELDNPTNHNNPGVPVGVLAAQPCNTTAAASCTCTAASGACPLAPSQYFGHSLSLANSSNPNTASNRTIVFKTTFSF